MTKSIDNYQYISSINEDIDRYMKRITNLFFFNKKSIALLSFLIDLFNDREFSHNNFRKMLIFNIFDII